MKKTILFLLAAALIIASCKSKPAKQKFVPHSDTTKIIGNIVDFKSEKIRYGALLIEIAFSAVDVDSFLNTKIVNDSLYYVMNDSAKTWSFIPKQFVCLDRNVDSAIIKLSRVIQENNLFKKDSLTEK